jgi:uncharacterized C2H2 Zn-finger protein
MSSDQHECDRCGATFDDREELQEHNREEHGQEQ